MGGDARGGENQWGGEGQGERGEVRGEEGHGKCAGEALGNIKVQISRAHQAVKPAVKS